MLIKYLGPSPSVNVGVFGPHRQDRVKEYPDPVGAELLVTCRRQLFEKVEESTGSDTEIVEPPVVGAVREPRPNTKRKRE